MPTQPEIPTPESQNPSALEAYGSYPFASDETYQQGLASIIAGGALDGNPPQDIKEEILRRTRVFYFNRVSGRSITMDEAREYELSSGDAARSTNHVLASSNDPADDETRVLTFAELKDLIESGRVDQIPNNKVIPEAFSDAPPSESTAPVRKKPWEISAEGPGT